MRKNPWRDTTCLSKEPCLEEMSLEQEAKVPRVDEVRTSPDARCSAPSLPSLQGRSLQQIARLSPGGSLARKASAAALLRLKQETGTKTVKVTNADVMSAC